MRALPVSLSTLTALLGLAVMAPALSQGQQAAGASAAPGRPALDESARRVAEDIPDEGTPDPGEHYPISNEWRHDLWFPHVRDLGGAFVGVGSDQCYTLAAVQDAELMWLVDFDPLVPRVHRMYSVLVPASDTPEALVARFDERQASATRALLEEGLAGAPDLAEVVRAFERHRSRWARYLQRVLRLRREGTRASWLSDPVLYARVRALFAAGRVVARNGDLTGARAVRAIGAAAQRLGVPVRVVYLSNAEQFFPYGEGFEANVRALPGDERTVLLRTFRAPRATYPAGDRWHYVVHRWPDFVDRLGPGG
jgi:hypothetical protein